MFRENQSRKAVSLTDLRSAGGGGCEQSTTTTSESSEPFNVDDCMLYGIGHSSQPQVGSKIMNLENEVGTEFRIPFIFKSTSVINVMGCCSQSNYIDGNNSSWNSSSHRSEDDSGIEIPSSTTTVTTNIFNSFDHHPHHRRLNHFNNISNNNAFKERHRINFFDHRGGGNSINSNSSSSSFKLIRGKVQKKNPYSLIPTRRKSYNEIRLPNNIQRNGSGGVGLGLLTRYTTTKAIRRGNCIYIGKAASVALENGDFDDFMIPSSSSSSSDSPSYVLTSPPRCKLGFNPTKRRRHSLYAKVYSEGQRIVEINEEDGTTTQQQQQQDSTPRSIVEGLNLDRSASCVENGNHISLIPTGSLSVDLSTPQFESTLNRFNSLCITMKSGEIGLQRPAEYNSMTDNLCTQFSTMMLPPSLQQPQQQQSHSTGHSPFCSPHPNDTNIPWTQQPSQSAQDLLTPNATNINSQQQQQQQHPSSIFFNPSTNSSPNSSTFFSTCLKN